MRADRLLSILLILQQRREVTARDLARELGVSVRTIARDMEALAVAGIPVYAERGIGGGWRLVEDFYTDLTGMTQSELGALRLLNIPESLSALQPGADLRSALLKLFAAAARREPGGDSQTQLIFLDWAETEHHPEAAAHLQLLYSALRQSCFVRLRYHYLNFIDVEQQVAPRGLVASGGAWFLVYAVEEQIRAKPVVELLEVQLLESHFRRPDGFDLADSWRTMRAQMAGEYGYRVRLRTSPQQHAWLEAISKGGAFRIGERVSAQQPDGWYESELFFENLESAREVILAWGGSVEVLEPRALRLSVGDYAVQILARYREE